ncbi:ParB N-terminal domain-containing protein [Rhodobacteraceae bacterium 2376]|uniref:ParB N-terminal domain-containing protein n=1 Tax=Rhabdonatronobacter sediminivivens TaxID=2743469 RepID=A0A7Z0L0W3_9RHOB|nr:ParB N-terminal domain-containing protein [Rhabdonatronobacter sediminivivens]NYS26466.1 ParB N-terminal domain-containing protein [Rhabdonatronobacter sediminivivens]
MARRKRLTLPPTPEDRTAEARTPEDRTPEDRTPEDRSGPAPETKSMPGAQPGARSMPGAQPGARPTPGPLLSAPPIAQVAGEASATHALEELSQEWHRARIEGRLVQSLPLDAIDEGHLLRDRMAADPADMADLIASIRERGQQAPIEVVALEGGRFGLIAGWRRLRALRTLLAETGDPRFGTVLALLRRPASAAEAYRAMVEENEIRAGISYYERARIAARAARAGVHPDPRAAIAALFAAAPRARRSKIASFLVLHDALDDRLRFASAIPERLGLALARALERDPDLRPRLRERLRKSAPETAAAELALLERALGAGDAPATPTAPAAKPRSPADTHDDTPPDTPRGTSAESQKTLHREEIRPGIWLETEGGFSRARLTLSGTRVDGPLRDRLVAWLRDNS